jgi:16S rRNA (cytosine967-C5)-methyltransferase
LGARAAALNVLQSLFFSERPLHEGLEKFISRAGLDPRDTAFARAIVMTVLRRLGEIDGILKNFLHQALPVRSGPAELILRMATAELVFMDVPAHATVSSVVNMADSDHRARHFKGLINAVARRVAAEGKQIATTQDAAQLNMPTWAWQLLEQSYGEPAARGIATGHMTEPQLDLTCASDQEGWAKQLDAVLLPTGSLRRKPGGRVEDLPGYASGQWWVQDAAAAMPARLLGDIKGKTVIDLCAAPGGKTAQLAAAGATVTAVDLDPARLSRVRENLQRLHLRADLQAADARTWRPPAPVDAVLLDAPCSATGTARRHPEVLWRKDFSDILAQAGLQHDIIDAAAEMVAPGGLLVYCVCSLAPEEGEDVVDTFLERNKSFAREPVTPADCGGEAAFVTRAGDLRTLPCHWPDLGSLDGFYAARLRRTT